MPVPVILDSDPGHDDVFAIWLAAGNPNIDLLGVTTVGGNGQLENTTTNARIALSIAGVTDVPVAAGADEPLTRTLTTAEAIHGDNGLGGIDRPEPTVPLDRRSALEFLSETLEAAVEPITLVPTGPLTNIATFLTQHPELHPKVKEIIWMGGSTGRGNVRPYAEFNAWVDPEAASIVFASGLPVTMVGLNVTHQALITADVLGSIEAIDNDTSAFGAELLRRYCAAYVEEHGMSEGPLHDPVAVALAVDRHVATTQRCFVGVETTSELTAGATVVDLEHTLGHAPNADVALQLDVERFWALVRDAVGALR